MKQEDTVYDNENTVYDDKRATDAANANTTYTAADNAAAEDAAESVQATPEAKKGSAWKSASVGAGTGILLGTVASFVTTNAIADDGSGAETEGVFDGNVETGGESQPAWADDEVSIATGVNDDMSFSEAFAAARAEVGAGGAFEWRGGVYGTFTADEWNNMSAEERAEYNDHFSWSNHTTSSSAAAAGEPEVAEATTDSNAENGDDAEDSDYIADNDGDIQGEEISVDDVQVAEVQGEDIPGEEVPGGDQPVDVEVVESDSDVEILGVTEDVETGSVIGGMMVGDQEVVLIDVDGGNFDYMVADVNNDQQITDDEVFDISDQGISVEAFADAAAANDVMYASNDDGTTDYINDGYDIA